MTEDKLRLLSNIPDELKQLNQWLVWRQENVVGSSKPTKIPYNPKTGKKASVTDPSHWCSYNDAVNCLANGGSYNGVGLVLTRNDPYFVCDLDNAKGNKAIIDQQKKIAEKFDTYSEISPSGMGLHTVGKGSIPSGRRKDCIEIYSSERYITFTGNVYNNKPIKDCQTELTKLYNELSGEVNNLAHTTISMNLKDIQMKKLLNNVEAQLMVKKCFKSFSLVRGKVIIQINLGTDGTTLL